jgi:hypothetical protein
VKSSYLTELPCGLNVNVVQQNVQQQRHTTTGMHDRRQRLRAAEVAPFSCAPVVRIEVVRPCWPLFGRQTTLNAATYCAPVSSISAGQQRSGQVAGARDTVYGSDGWTRRAITRCVPVAHRAQSLGG